jgi:glycosyltransferase involved in cell wall biosynthesis
MQKFSILITAKDRKSRKLTDLLRSIEKQDYPKDKVEVIITTEGTPESAKAIGLKKATGDIVCFMASDCEFTSNWALKEVAYKMDKNVSGAFSSHYFYNPSDPILNRYFALFGFNDPVPFYLGKCDRLPYYQTNDSKITFPHNVPTLGDNGFFVWRNLIKQTNLNEYSHIDNCEDLRKLGHYHYAYLRNAIWHKTGDSLWLWAKKRIHYANTLNKNRRWKMISNGKDMVTLLIFIILALSVVEPTLRGLYGYLKSGIKDKAWFMHPIVCFITVLLYGASVLQNGTRRLYVGTKNCP